VNTCLIGHTGFVAGNLARQYQFDRMFNASTIGSIRARIQQALPDGDVTATLRLDGQSFSVAVDHVVKDRHSRCRSTSRGTR